MAFLGRSGGASVANYTDRYKKAAEESHNTVEKKHIGDINLLNEVQLLLRQRAGRGKYYEFNFQVCGPNTKQ